MTREEILNMNDKGIIENLLNILEILLATKDSNYDIDFFEETKPLGTIGSVSLLKGKITTPFFVSNCDIIIDQDYRDVYEYHQSNHNDLTIVTAVKSIRIPYGVIETGEDGLMTELQEKPEATYMINTGVYILNPVYPVTLLYKKCPEEFDLSGAVLFSMFIWLCGTCTV